jgi:hypothetical protein
MTLARIAITSFCLILQVIEVLAQVRKIEIIDSTQIIFDCDTINKLDSQGRRHGAWLEWSTNAEYIQSTIEHLQDDKGDIHGVMTASIYKPRTIYDFRIDGIGKYQHGIRHGQWLWYSEQGTIEWIRTYADSGKLISVLRLSSTGMVEMAAISDSLNHDGLLNVFRFNKEGLCTKQERVESSVLEPSPR